MDGGQNLSPVTVLHTHRSQTIVSASMQRHSRLCMYFLDVPPACSGASDHTFTNGRGSIIVAARLRRMRSTVEAHFTYPGTTMFSLLVICAYICKILTGIQNTQEVWKRLDKQYRDNELDIESTLYRI